jgi:hypothetical protein
MSETQALRSEGRNVNRAALLWFNIGLALRLVARSVLRYRQCAKSQKPGTFTRVGVKLIVTSLGLIQLFLQQSFAIAQEKNPALLLQDASLLIEEIEKRKFSDMDSFETLVDFQRRSKKFLSQELYEGVPLSSNRAFLIPIGPPSMVYASYDVEKKTLTISVSCRILSSVLHSDMDLARRFGLRAENNNDPLDSPEIMTCYVAERREEGLPYVGETPLGLRKLVERREVVVDAIGLCLTSFRHQAGGGMLRNHSDRCLSLRKKYPHWQVTIRGVSVERAKALIGSDANGNKIREGSLRAAVLGNISAPVVTKSKYISYPTIQSPYHETTHYRILHISPSRMIFFSEKNNETIAQIPFRRSTAR